jgi:hypothetical protein
VRVRPLAGRMACLAMDTLSVFASMLLTVVANLLLG